MAEALDAGRADGRTTSKEVDELLLRIRGLVFAKAILEARGAGEEEIEAHRREIERLRWRLAGLVSSPDDDFGAAA